MIDMLSSSSASVTCDDPDRDQFLQHILASQLFKKSPRLKGFLSYICERSFAKRFDEISEVQIAVNVFGRSPDYNAGEDTIVRSAARQLRQKLELYSVGEGADSDWRLTIPKGSYIPVFERNAANTDSIPPVTDEARQSGAPRWFLIALVTAAACGTLIWGGLFLAQTMDPRTIFWRAILTSNQATLLVSGDSGLAMLQSETTHHTVHVRDYAERKFAPRPLGNPILAGDDPLAVFERRRYTSMADLTMAVKTAFIADKLGLKLDVKYARDISLSDLKAGSVILVGDPFGNPWVELFAGQLNFDFQIDATNGTHFIVNRAPSAQENAAYRAYPGDPTNKAYAMIALTGGLGGHGRALLIEGTTVAGIDTAVDFLFNSDRFSDVIKPAIHGGSIDDFEVLLETENVAARGTQFKVVGFRMQHH